MRPSASRLLRTRRQRVRLGVAIAFTSLLGAIPMAGLLPSPQAQTAPPIPIPGIALPDVPFPDLPGTADLQSLLEMLPAGVDLDNIDLTGGDLLQGDDLKKLLASLPINVIDTTF